MTILTMVSGSLNAGMEHELDYPDSIKIVAACISACRNGKLKEFGDFNFSRMDRKHLEEVESTIRTHKVAGLLYDISRHCSFAEEFLGRLQRLQDLELAQHLRQKSGFIALQKLLSNKVEIINVKGIDLHERYYSDLYVRSSTDIDILVAEESYPLFADCLRGAGYTKQQKSSDRRDRLVGRWTQEAVAWSDPAVGVQLDVHILPSRQFETLYEQSEVYALQAPYHEVLYRALSPVNLFEYLCNHAAKHGWCRMQWCIDIDQILRKVSQEEKNEILMKARYSSENLNMMIGLLFIEHLLRSDAHTIQLSRWYTRKVKRLFDRMYRNSLGQEPSRFVGWEVLRYRWNSTRRIAGRFISVLSFIFTPTQNDLPAPEKDISSVHLIIFGFMRPFRGLFRFLSRKIV